MIKIIDFNHFKYGNIRMSVYKEKAPYNYYEDFEYYEDDSNEIETQSDDDSENYNMKTKTVFIKESKFDESNFDVKVARSIVKTHKKTLENKYSNWVNKNLKHLENLYNISELNISKEKFFSFVYDNSFHS